MINGFIYEKYKLDEGGRGLAWIGIAYAFIALSACTTHKAANPEKLNNISNLEVFQHPVFHGLSKICLPFIDARSSDESLTIDNLAKEAGFREGLKQNWIYESSPGFLYSIGSRDYGAEVEVESNRDKKSCGSSVINAADKHPSALEFTQWLKRENSGWEVIYDGSYRENPEESSKTVYLIFCNRERAEYEQGLIYLGQEREGAGPHGTTNTYISLNVEDVGKQKCSGYLKKYGTKDN